MAIVHKENPLSQLDGKWKYNNSKICELEVREFQWKIIGTLVKVWGLKIQTDTRTAELANFAVRNRQTTAATWTGTSPRCPASTFPWTGSPSVLPESCISFSLLRLGDWKVEISWEDFSDFGFVVITMMIFRDESFVNLSSDWAINI